MSRRMYVVHLSEYRQVIDRREVDLPKDGRSVNVAMHKAMSGWSILPGDSIKIELLVV